MSTSDIDAEALKDYCPNCGDFVEVTSADGFEEAVNCEEDHIHTTHGRCLGCLRQHDVSAAE